RIPCSWHYGYTVINASGTVSPCCAPWDEVHDFGIVHPRAGAFSDVWNNEQFQTSRAAFAGQGDPLVKTVKTLWLECPYGADVQQMYDGLEAHVVAQFKRVLGGTDSTLDRAYDLLCDRPKFVEYYRRRLIAKAPASGPGSLPDTIRDAGARTRELV